jgi:diaminopimelate epimerase
VEERPIFDMKVWERGVGVTAACGTGATACALAAHSWGLVDAVCDVVQPGGTASVEVIGTTATLIGPSQFICALSFPWAGAR